VSAAALVLFVVYLAVGFVLRTWLQWRRTGDSGFRGISGSPEWLAGVAFVVVLLAGLLGPVAALAGLKPVAWLQGPGPAWAGLVVAAAGIAGTLVTQLRMWSSWRIGVHETERTDLVTRGAFAVVRNPIFTVVALTGAGLVLMAPNVVALAGFAMLLLACSCRYGSWRSRTCYAPTVPPVPVMRLASVGSSQTSVGSRPKPKRPPGPVAPEASTLRLTGPLPPVRTIY
jgi:protein-S-isoprenylcysteine O-methyltransferase Ste14